MYTNRQTNKNKDNMHKKRLMIDLDGVLNTYSGSFNENVIPEIREGAAEFLEELCRLNKYELVLFTARNTKLCEKWLKENKINRCFSEITNIKKPASIYLDDRALKFNGSFPETLAEIENFTVHWKN